MGHVDLYIDSPAGTSPFSTDALLTEYFEPQPGKQLTIRVRSGSKTVHEAILDLINGAGPAAYGVDIRGESWYIDRVRQAGDANSAAVGVDAINLPEMEGVWGVIVDGDDGTRIPGSQREIEMQIFVLAKFGEYSSLSNLSNNKEVSVP